MSTFNLSPGQAIAAQKVADNALRFERSVNFPLGVAIIQYHFGDGTAEAVLDALSGFQNEDGGHGNGLEVDIASPVSNPFANRLALTVLLSLRETPVDPLIDRLAAWLNTNQNEDGDWHFAPEVTNAALAPWFAGWTFPSLNPACCLAGLGNALGVLSPTTTSRTAALFAEKASVDQARSADLYGLLPYVEYFRTAQLPDRDSYLDAIAENIRNTTYDDASHFFSHALGAGPDLTARLGPAILSSSAVRLLDEPLTDGGWPNPYSESWRPFATAAAVMTLAKLRDGT